jgi:DNA-binding CsgD family transcriptional regulator
MEAESPRFQIVKALADELGLEVLAKMEVQATRYRPVPERLINALARAEPSTRLTLRERQVMVLLTSGLYTREIAAEMHLGKETVKSHLRTIYDKLDVRNQVEAINAFLEEAA